MADYVGPQFRFIDEISAEALAASGGFQPCDRPLLVKGALKRWSASERWTFEQLAQLRRADGAEVVTSFSGLAPA